MSDKQQLSVDGSSKKIDRASLESSQVERVLWLQSLLGDSATSSDLAPLADRMVESYLPVGETLYEAGDASSALFFIVSGTIQQGAKEFGPGDILGFIDTMMDRPHAQSAQSLDEAVVLRLSIDDWFEHLEDHFKVLRKLILGSLRNAEPGPQFPIDGDPFVEGLRISATGDTGSAALVKQMLALKASALFRKASIQAITYLVRRARRLELSVGQCLETADLSPGIWILVSGKVEVARSASDKIYKADCSPGTLLFGLRALTSFQYSFCVRAKERTELLLLDSEDYFDSLETHFDVATSSLSYIASRVEKMNADGKSVSKAWSKI